MRKSHLITGTLTIVSLLMQGQLAFAQNAAGVPLSGEPKPQTGTTTTTTTTTKTTTTGTRTGTQTGTTTGTRTPIGATTGTYNPNANVPTPTDIPLVPTITQQTTPAPQTTTTNVCTQDQCTSTVNRAMGNEIIVMTVLFMGSGIGGLLWILGLMMMKKGIVERETHRMERQNRFQLQGMLTNEKTKAYNKYIDSVMSIVNKMQHKKSLAPDDLKTFQEGSVFINLNGSKHLRSMNDHIASLFNTGKPLATADQFHLRTELSKTIKGDLL